MNDSNLWLWLTAAGGLAATVWGYVSGWGRQLASHLVMRLEVEDTVARKAALVWLNRRLRRSGFGFRFYTGYLTHVRRAGRTLLIAAESIGKGGKLYWKGWLPIWVKIDTQDDALTLTYLRGTLDADAMMLDAAAMWNEIRAGDAWTMRRHRVCWVSGSVGRELFLQQRGNEAGTPPVAAPAERIEWEELSGLRLLGYTHDEIGAGSLDRHSAVEALAMSNEMSALLAEVEIFIQARSWHHERSIPWRLGSLLHGEPGCGKTSFVRAVAEEYDLPLYVYDLPTLRNDGFRKAWREMLASAPCVSLIEDIDGMFSGRDRLRGELSFDCLLNCLDGIERADGLLLFMTTNRLEKLDEALTRPGRVDRLVEFARPDEEARRQIARRILKGFDPIRIEDVVAEGFDDTGAAFQDRCVTLARRLFWEQPLERAPPRRRSGEPAAMQEHMPIG